MGDKTETWGNQGFVGAGQIAELTFHKLRNALQVSVNGNRTSWFDVDVGGLEDRKLTHMFVGSGVTDPEVVLKRPTCQQQCSAVECDSCMQNGESSPVETCFSKAAASCITSETTDEANMVDVAFCDGARQSVRFDTSGFTNSVHVVDDAAFLEQICGAHAFPAAKDEEDYNELLVNCKKVQGEPVEIIKNCVDDDCQSNLVPVWRPKNMRCYNSVRSGNSVRNCVDRSIHEKIHMPRDALFRSPLKISKKTVQADVTSWAFDIDTQIIGRSNDDALVGQRVVLMNSQPEGEAAVWRSWNQERGAAASGSVEIVVADGAFELEGCNDIGETDCSTCDENTPNDDCCNCKGGSYNITSLGLPAWNW